MISDLAYCKFVRVSQHLYDLPARLMRIMKMTSRHSLAKVFNAVLDSATIQVISGNQMCSFGEKREQRSSTCAKQVTDIARDSKVHGLLTFMIKQRAK